MAPRRTPERLLGAGASALVLSLVLVGCVGTAQPKPVVSPSVGFDQAAAMLVNDPIPRADQRFVCGSRDFSFGQEIVTLDNPAEATVKLEWSEIVPGKLVFMTGTVSDIEGGEGTPLREGADLPFAHPFGYDFTFDAVLDPQYKALSQEVGSAPNDIPTGTIKTELEKGQIPHSDPTNYLAGFFPKDGDRIAFYGNWILDCGHGDFHTEMHPPTFVSFGHPEGTATVSHAFYYPYEVTGLYNPDPSLVSDVTNPERLTDPGTKPLPGYLVDELARVVNKEHDRLEGHVVVKAHDVRPLTWYTCAPRPRPAGARLTASYQFTARPGIDIVATPDDSLGCVRFDLKVGAGYQPAPLDRFDCSVPWTTLNPDLQEALMDDSLDILELIKEKAGPAAAPAVEKDPLFDCYDPFVVPPPGAPSGNGVVTNANQPYPFYGQATVSWSR